MLSTQKASIRTYIFKCLFLRERKRERDRALQLGEGQRERGRQKIQSRLCLESIEPDVGLELTNHEIVT